MLRFISIIWQNAPSHGDTEGSWHTYRKVHFLDGELQVFESHSHGILSVIQVAEVSHDNFCTLLQRHKEELCL